MLTELNVFLLREHDSLVYLVAVSIDKGFFDDFFVLRCLRKFSA